MTTRITLTMLLLSAALLWSGMTGVSPEIEPLQADRQERSAQSISEVVESTPQLSELNRMLEAAGMKDSLRRGGPYTIFLPTNRAFYRLSYDERKSLWNPDNREKIRRILSNHILDRRFTAEELANRSTVPSRLEDLPIDTTGEVMQVKGCNIIQTDVEASNGIIHVVDRLIMPTYPDRDLAN